MKVEQLIFQMTLPGSPQPKMVETLLKYEGVFGQDIFKATSGLPGVQYEGSWKCKGRGVIPPCELVEIEQYKVSTNRLWLPQVRGVEGSFFPISPFEVNINGVKRGDFGIHYDANVPGSSGCNTVRLSSKQCCIQRI